MREFYTHAETESKLGREILRMPINQQKGTSMFSWKVLDLSGKSCAKPPKPSFNYYQM
jgi:hypothetical protein